MVDILNPKPKSDAIHSEILHTCRLHPYEYVVFFFRIFYNLEVWFFFSQTSGSMEGEL